MLHGLSAITRELMQLAAPATGFLVGLHARLRPISGVPLRGRNPSYATQKRKLLHLWQALKSGGLQCRQSNGRVARSLHQMLHETRSIEAACTCGGR